VFCASASVAAPGRLAMAVGAALTLGRPAMADGRDTSAVEISTDSYAFRLAVSPRLSALSWTNRLTGHTLDLGGFPEVEVDIGAGQRLQIGGWRCWRFENENTEYAEPAFRDADWQGRATPIPIVPDVGHEWARTHVFVPESARGRPISLTIGGCGVYDFCHSRVYLNGRAVGERHALRRWNDPASIPLPAELIHYGGDNVIALDSTDEVTRTPELDAFDPVGAWSVEQKGTWPFFFEQYLTVGDPLATPDLTVTRVRRGDRELIVDLTAESPPLSVRVAYRWEPDSPVLRRMVTVRNDGDRAIRLMNLRLGTYRAERTVTNGDLGFPVVLDDERFVGLAHPAGWATGQDGVARLRQFPGAVIPAGGSYEGFEAVLGVAPEGCGKSAFVEYLEGRMRRTVRRHDHPYAIYESLASWPGEDFFGCSEETVTRQIEAAERFTAQTGCRFDILSVEFWHDPQGDLQRADPLRFPRGLVPLSDRLRAQGMRLGLWYDTQMARWNIVESPLSRRALNFDEAYGSVDIHGFCRATEPFPTFYKHAFRYHTEHNGVRLLKMDGMLSVCTNPYHDHLPGLYSIEPIDRAIIANLEQLDAACPEAFVMLYWGSRSPWWLLHGDTIFDAGLAMEAASPSSEPTLYVRDSVTVGLDQALKYCEYVPPLGKDSLGVWLSDWAWNSCIGSERWQEGFVMDMARGNLLAQPWAGLDRLTTDEARQMAEFIQLLRAQPECFRRSRLVLGDPWKHKAYGYLCSDGRRVFIAANNCMWNDAVLDLHLGPRWDLPDVPWSLVRWYPRPARLARTDRVRLRPFEVVLLEAVPDGLAPSLGKAFEPEAASTGEPEPSVELPVDCGEETNASEEGVRSWQVRCVVPRTRSGGLAHVAATLWRDGKAWPQGDIGRLVTASAINAGSPVPIPVVRERSYPSAWQGWRFEVPAGTADTEILLRVTAGIPPDVTVTYQAHFVPT